MSNSIKVTMRDTWSDQIVERTIDISNFTLSTGFIPSVERQRVILNDWINDRANAQHDTDLTLVSWFIA